LISGNGKEEEEARGKRPEEERGGDLRLHLAAG